MHMRTTLVGILAAVLILASAATAASKTKIVVFQFEPIGVDETTAKIAVELLRGELSRTEMFYAVVGEELCRTPEEAARLARSLEAEKTVTGSLSALGAKIIVRASLIDVKTGGVEFEDQIVSASVEDLDVVMKRLALGLVQKKKYEETAEVEAIVEKETEEPRRRKTYWTWGVAVGGLMPLGNSYGGADPIMLYDAIGWYEAPDYVAQAVFSIGPDEYAGLHYLEIGLLKFFSRTDFAPYAGANLGVQWMTIASDAWRYTEESRGPSVSVEGGLVGFRTYDIRLVAKAKYAVAFARLPDQGTQHGFAIGIGLLVHSPEKEKGGCLGGCWPF